MCLPQWLLKALRQVLRGHARGLSSLKAIVLLWRFFRRLFKSFSCTQDDREPDKPRLHIVDQVSYLPQGTESMKSTMSLAVDDNTDVPIMSVVCQSTALPNDPRSSHGMASLSVVSHSQAGLAIETDLNPSDAHSNPLQLSQDTSTIVLNSAADVHLNSVHSHLPSARSTSGEIFSPSGSEAGASVVVMPLLTITAWNHGQNEHSLSTLHSAHPFFMPILPRFLRRTGTRQRNPYDPNGAWIAPLTTSFTLHGVPSDWSLHVNTMGARYYVHKKMFHTLIFTFEDPVLPAVLQELTRFLDNIISYMHSKGITLPPKVDLVLGFGQELEDHTHICKYYFADHTHHSIFWLDGFNANMHPNVTQYNTSEPSHLAHVIEAEYWFHSGLFPVCQEITSDTIEEVNDFLIHGIAENTWALSIEAAEHKYTLPELQQYFSILNSIRSEDEIL
ncbi:hypothetical protein EDD85DRAFT_1029231 [Armillaria nabsnona]|nr:hypothetical protein EDD85DRAFT_1029231 [Armillaria nabsnona]